MSHTPAPWLVDKDLEAVRSGHFGSPLMGDFRGVIICTFADAHGGEARMKSVEGVQQEIEANARLIAAAPELLTTLQAIYRWLQGDGTGNDCSLAREIEQQMEQAILKAGGEL